MNFNVVNTALKNADWDQALNTEDIDAAFSTWTSIYLGMIKKLIPSKVVKQVKPKNPYVTPEIESEIKAKRAALRRMKKDNTAETQQHFKQLRNRVTHLLRKSERPTQPDYFAKPDWSLPRPQLERFGNT